MMTFRDAFDRVFEDAFGRALTGYDGAAGMPVDMYQTADEVVVKATMPGVKTEDISITVSGDVLMIRGEMKSETEKNEASYHIRERRYGSYSRSLPLPTSVSADKAKAEFEHGVLTLTIPKAEEVKPKTITVRAK
jgi:HSP20 family protein